MRNFIYFSKIENDLKEKTEKIDLLTKELQQSRLIIQKNEAEFEQKLKNLGQDFELKINVIFKNFVFYLIIY